MFLSDVDIKKCVEKGVIRVYPSVKQEDYRPSGIRLHLSNIIYELNKSKEPVDIRNQKITQNQVLMEKFYKKIDLLELENEGNSYILEPGRMILGSTVEKISLPNYMIGFLDGRSTIARFGITNNITASFIDNMNNREPKNITLEIGNCGSLRFVLYPNLPIGMLLFANLSSDTETISSGQYVDNQVLPNLEYIHKKNII
jgi:dCTP deaminase